MSAFTPVVKPANQVNWADETISRAGVCPVYMNGGHKFVGFGVSNYSAVISPLGGSFEDIDSDLLMTAVREYNEEVGKNFPPIEEFEVENRYAVINEYTIQIFLPVSAPIEDFVKTQELYDMLWITPLQLEIISNNQEYEFRNPHIKIFRFGERFKNILKIIAVSVENEIAFATTENPEFERSGKVYREIVPEVVTGFDLFKEDTKIHNNFLGHISLAITPETIGLASKTKIYLIPNTKEVFEEIAKLKVRAYVAFEEDLRKFKFVNKKQNIQVISGAPSESGGPDLRRNFMRNVSNTRREGDIISELDLIQEYEAELYNANEATGKWFSEQRAVVLSSITFLNKILAIEGQVQEAELIKSLKSFLREKTRDYRMSAEVILEELQFLGLYQTHKNGLVRIVRRK